MELKVDWKDTSVSLFTMDGVILARSNDSAKGKIYERMASCTNACDGMDHFDPEFRLLDYIKKTDADMKAVVGQRDAIKAALRGAIAALEFNGLKADQYEQVGKYRALLCAKPCPVCEDSACETKSAECGKGA